MTGEWESDWDYDWDYEDDWEDDWEDGYGWADWEDYDWYDVDDSGPLPQIDPDDFEEWWDSLSDSLRDWFWGDLDRSRFPGGGGGG